MQKIDTSYGYNPNGRQPRVAIGQLDRLSYVMVVADNATANDYIGVTHQELAEFMLELGCVEALNLDGGGTACMFFNGKSVMQGQANLRSMGGMIAFGLKE